MNNPFAKKLELEYCGCDCHMMCIGGTEPPLGGHCSNCMESDHTPAAFSPPTTQGDTNLTQPSSGEQPTSVEDKIHKAFGNDTWIFQDSPWLMPELSELISEERRQAKIEELETLLKEVPMPALSYEQVENRLTELRGENNEK